MLHPGLFTLDITVLLQAALVWEEARGAPAKKGDILAGTEFLSVFINGAMATPPPRRRGFRPRGGHQAVAASDSATAESHQHEASSIYRISRTNPASGGRPISVSRPQTSGREEVVRFYPINQKTLENRQQNLASLIDDLSTPGGISSTRLTPSSAATTTMTSAPTLAHQDRTISRSNGTNGSAAVGRGVSRQKVIGVSVTSTVEATPYKVRVEHYDSADAAVVTRPPSLESAANREITREPIRESTRSTARGTSRPPTPPSSTTTTTTTTTTTMTTATPPPPGRFVTEELSNIVSESNRSEFSVDEDLPRTSWRSRVTMTPRVHVPAKSHQDEEANEAARIIDVDAITLPTEENYELPVENSERRELNEEVPEISTDRLQGRKMGRHYDTSLYNRSGPKAYGQSSKAYKSPRTYNEPAKVYGEPAKVYGEPERVYGEPAKVYSEPAKVYSEPAKVYSEPAKVYGEPAKVYGEPEKIYSEPSKIYSEPAKIYSEPAKIYSQPAKVYGEPSKVYDSEGQPVDRQQENGEPDEQNYEIDESVSVGSNGNVHGPQLVVTEETPGASGEDGHKVGYVVEGRNYRKYRVEERTPDGFIVGEYGVVSHDDGSLRGVRYTADGTINPQLIYDALMKFLAL
ncbi:PREDICTED: uncharacterized protein LOC105449482 [Wasmannia auropunctata]|uniref:uncharacterized protein LOC105449482 n=1 Tax=Wasmannia auropunctata TaxID=64793 RepID=UPI0005EEB8B9|nr:PREDICTED: uncharacterized protein LOC105449482 [Wasmannia auropunctata]